MICLVLDQTNIRWFHRWLFWTSQVLSVIEHVSLRDETPSFYSVDSLLHMHRCGNRWPVMTSIVADRPKQEGENQLR